MSPFAGGPMADGVAIGRVSKPRSGREIPQGELTSPEDIKIKKTRTSFADSGLLDKITFYDIIKCDFLN